MALFSKRRRDDRPFWQVAPFASGDPGVLYQHGISCVTNSDGRGMMSTGWAIWNLTDINEHQTADFLRDGYKEWRDTPDFDRVLAAQFLQEVLARLASNPDASWPDLYAVPPEIVEPISTHYSVRCWAASELLEVADPELRSSLEPAVYDAITQARRDFVPGRSMSWAETYADTHGLAMPWQ